jgi:pimeloyl-ACP methyl ester carboxylesterase
MVRAGENVTAYLRTGNGKPVILLRIADHHDRLWALTLEQLSLGFRVILPEVAPDAATLEDWFTAFHDGLGIGAASLVVDDNYAVAATRLALAHGTRIDRLVFISTKSSAGEQLGELKDSWSSESHPLLVIAGTEPVEQVALRIVEFLHVE